MKRKLAITAIVVLAIGFVGLAGVFTTLFTNSVAVQRATITVCRNADGVEVTNPDDLFNLEMEYKLHKPNPDIPIILPPRGSGKASTGSEPTRPQDGWCGEYAQRTYGYTLNEEPWENPCPFSEIEGYTKAQERRNCEYKKEFDPRSTAMFAIGGVIIGLLPLARKRVK